MNAKDKRRFDEMAEKDKVRYDREMANYQPADGSKKRRRKHKDPNAPKRALWVKCTTIWTGAKCIWNFADNYCNQPLSWRSTAVDYSMQTVFFPSGPPSFSSVLRSVPVSRLPTQAMVLGRLPRSWENGGRSAPTGRSLRTWLSRIRPAMRRWMLCLNLTLETFTIPVKL